MMIGMDGRAGRRGIKPGTRLRGRDASFDPTSGKPYITGARFDNPDEAMKLIRAAEKAEVSVAEILRQAIRYMPVDDEGRPVWPTADQAHNEQLRLDMQPEQQRAA